MRKILPVFVLALLLAACGNTATSPSLQQPTAMAAKPTDVAMAEKPTDAAMMEKPTDAAMMEKPTDAAMAGSHTVPLKYLDGLSNAGPTDATGTLTLLPDKNSIIVDVKGLSLIPGKVFEVWLLPAAISGGRFTTASDGAGHLEQIVKGNLKDYNQILLTIEPEPDDSPKPTNQHSIGSDKF
jgi:hypothetical protein